MYDCIYIRCPVGYAQFDFIRRIKSNLWNLFRQPEKTLSDTVYMADFISHSSLASSAVFSTRLSARFVGKYLSGCNIYSDLSVNIPHTEKKIFSCVRIRATIPPIIFKFSNKLQIITVQYNDQKKNE